MDKLEIIVFNDVIKYCKMQQLKVSKSKRPLYMQLVNMENPTFQSPVPSLDTQKAKSSVNQEQDSLNR
jgi:hypothetical protein